MKTLLFAGALLAPSLVSAQDAAPPPASAPVSLPTVVVTATRTEQAPDDTLAATTVITRDEIERSQANDIADILRFQAGLDLGRTGGVGQQTSVFIRGGESNHTLVLIDGVRVNPSTSGGAALQNITPDMIERIEIVKGPRSTLYGSDAIGGVINLVTRSGSTSGADLRLRAAPTRPRKPRRAWATATSASSSTCLRSSSIPTAARPAPAPASTAAFARPRSMRAARRGSANRWKCLREAGIRRARPST